MIHVPLYKVEQLALDDPEAAAELARRYVDSVTRHWHKDAHRTRLTTAWLKGFGGEPNAHRAGNNFTAPYSRAWRRGEATRRKLEELVNGGAQ